MTELLCRFIRRLNEKEQTTPAELTEAVAFIADEMNLGRLTAEIQIDPTPTAPHGMNRKMVIYTSDDGFTKENAKTRSYAVQDPGSFVLTAMSRPECSFPDEMVVEAVMDLVHLSAELNYMMEKADRQGMLQVLTGLPNAGGYMREVGRKYQERKVDTYDSYYFNLTGYGLINKQFGQKEGDAVMKRYVGILLADLEEDELLGHLGGDNFVALIHQGERSRQFQKQIEHVETYAVQYDKKIPLVITSVAGMMRVTPQTPPDQIISGPAVACSFAKKTKTPLVVLNEELNEKINRSKIIEQGFEKALKNHEFTVFYQPKVNAETGELIGAEALARWYENGRLVPPVYFIPVLEQSSRITELDLEMLEIVCRDLSEWKKEGKKLYPISVNFSRRDLLDPDLFEKIQKLLDQYQIPKDCIIIEITETTSEKEKSLMIQFLNRLRNFGIQVSIDDFGTGYSSLGILREMPINEIKLDRSFINKKLDHKDEIIIQSVIDMSKKLNIDIIQEGVETEGQRDFIVHLGCKRIQGFLYSQPLPKYHYDEWVKNGRCPD